MSLSLNAEILKPYSNNDVFIETGSLTGGGIAIALYSGFREIHSVEVNPDYYGACLKSFGTNPKVHLYLGDSKEVLPNILKKINKQATFFLDSHVAHNTSLSKGENEVPLLSELEAIKKHPINTHTILIDDSRLMGKTPQGNSSEVSLEWLFITKDVIIKRLLEINPEYLIEFIDSTNAPGDLMVARIP